MVARVPLRGYDVVVEAGLVASVARECRELLPSTHRFAVIADANLAAVAGQIARSFGQSASVFSVPPGESSKTRESWIRLTDEMLSGGFGRDSAVVAVGGGVVGDLAGFVAATFMRGIPWVNVPTSLLAMVDASIGGKTGVDTPAAKNPVGAFHNPRRVFIDPQVLVTLPLRHLCAGLAEVIKHGVIADPGYLDTVGDALPRMASGEVTGEAMTPVIIRSAEIKAAVVGQDEHEGGIRRILNFGHTIGHAIEAAGDFSLLHGEAIGIGMVIESRIAERAGIADEGLAARVEALVAGARLPVTVPKELDRQRIWSALRKDKKNREGRVAFALPRRPGVMAGAESGWSVEVGDELIKEALR